MKGTFLLRKIELELLRSVFWLMKLSTQTFS